MTKFKEHFKINGGTFKTHEDEVEAYVKKMIKDFRHKQKLQRKKDARNKV